jgi:hypothetical protein
MLKARERHIREMEEKSLFKERKAMEEQNLRIKNLSNRQESLNRREMKIEAVQERNRVSFTI